MGFAFVAIFIPLLTAAVLYFLPTWPIKEPENKKKFLILIFSGLGIGAVISGSLYAGGLAKMYHSEIWNFKNTGLKHEERWSEREQRSRQVPDGTYTTRDSKGRTTTHTKYRTEYYYVTAYYGPYWNKKDEYGDWTVVNQSEYNKWRAVWGNEKRTGQNTGSAAGLTVPITGQVYQCAWSGSFETIYPGSAKHTYKNKVRESDSIFKFKEPTEALIAKYPRPADKGNATPAFGGVDGNELLLLKRVNATLGPKHQVHTILMYFAGQPRDIVNDVMSAWGGPNKNELVTFVGVDGGAVTWCSVWSWMDNTTIHKSIESALVGKEWSAKIYADALQEFVPTQWKRKQFEDFEYLEVDIHIGWMVTALLLGIAANVGLFFILEAKMS